MSRTYTKADLEKIVYTQLENLNAMHDLLNIMKVQNELLHNANKKLKDEIFAFKEKQHVYPKRKRSSKSKCLAGRGASSFAKLWLAGRPCVGL